MERRILFIVAALNVVVATLVLIGWYKLYIPWLLLAGATTLLVTSKVYRHHAPATRHMIALVSCWVYFTATMIYGFLLLSMLFVAQD